MNTPLLSPAAGRRQRRELLQQIAREQRKQQRQHLVDLRAQIRQARAERHAALEQAKARCRAERLAARERVHALRERVLQELRQAVAAERASARETCSVRLSAARGISDRIARVRAELEADRSFQRELRRIERANAQRTRQAHRATAAQHRSESDDVVRSNLPPELVPLWERVKRSIRGSDRMSRTESFLHFVEENPGVYLEAIEDRTEDLVRELEEREREASRSLRELPAPPEAFDDEAPASYVDGGVPF
ncbi:MAG TPA: hypothetical protein VIJ33_05225 [Solirubrobacteraceae bacterium]